MKAHNSRKPSVDRSTRKVSLGELPKELRGRLYVLKMQRGDIIDQGELGDPRFSERGATFVSRSGTKICAFAAHTAIAQRKGFELIVGLNCGKVLTVKDAFRS